MTYKKKKKRVENHGEKNENIVYTDIVKSAIKTRGTTSYSQSCVSFSIF